MYAIMGLLDTLSAIGIFLGLIWLVIASLEVALFVSGMAHDHKAASENIQQLPKKSKQVFLDLTLLLILILVMRLLLPILLEK